MSYSNVMSITLLLKDFICVVNMMKDFHRIEFSRFFAVFQQHSFHILSLPQLKLFFFNFKFINNMSYSILLTYFICVENIIE